MRRSEAEDQNSPSLSGFGALIAEVEVERLLPLRLGNTWTYRVQISGSGDGSLTFDTTCVADYQRGDQHAFVVENFPSYELLKGDKLVSGFDVVTVDRERGRLRQLMGELFVPLLDLRSVLASERGPLPLPFSSALPGQVRLSPQHQRPGVTETYTLAPGIGIIEYSATAGARTVTAALVRHSVQLGPDVRPVPEMFGLRPPR